MLHFFKKFTLRWPALGAKNCGTLHTHETTLLLPYSYLTYHIAHFPSIRLLVATLIWEFNYPTPQRRIFFKMLELSSWPSTSWRLLMMKVSLLCSQTSPLNPPSVYVFSLQLHTLFFPRSIFIESYLHPGVPASGWRFRFIILCHCVLRVRPSHSLSFNHTNGIT